MTSTNNTSSTTEMTTPSQPTLRFKKTLREIREIEIDYEMDYDEFVANNMDKVEDEDDKEFAARCLAVWEALVDQEEKPKHRPAYVCLGEDEHEVDWGDWDGDAGEECADDITTLVDAENREFPKWVAWKAAERKRREEQAAIQFAEWKARQEQKAQKAKVAELEAKEAAQAAVMAAQAAKINALRAELKALGVVV
jgi:hypothetical protein